MKYLPVGLNIQGRDCLVVGGGPIGARKVRNLLRAGASVTLVSPEATRELAELARSEALNWIKEEFREEHLHGVFLAVAATDDKSVNARITEGAKGLGILICDASAGDRSDVIFGALHEDRDFSVAVFTDGEDPSRARKTRDEIASLLSPKGRGKESGLD